MEIIKNKSKMLNKKPTVRKNGFTEDELSLQRFGMFYKSLNKADQKKVIRAMILHGQLRYGLPLEYRTKYREYRELLSQNEDLFRRQDKEILYGSDKPQQELKLQK